jgi:ActR/RegA family two-component response regulator
VIGRKESMVVIELQILQSNNPWWALVDDNTAREHRTRRLRKLAESRERRVDMSVVMLTCVAGTATVAAVLALDLCVKIG